MEWWLLSKVGVRNIHKVLLLSGLQLWQHFTVDWVAVVVPHILQEKVKASSCTFTSKWTSSKNIFSRRGHLGLTAHILFFGAMVVALSFILRELRQAACHQTTKFSSGYGHWCPRGVFGICRPHQFGQEVRHRSDLVVEGFISWQGILRSQNRTLILGWNH